VHRLSDTKNDVVALSAVKGNQL